jgi:GTP-binding protein YchF
MLLLLRRPRSWPSPPRAPAPPLLRSASTSAGLVGLPNVGKSTLFNALVGRSQAEASNFPFCTIEPNVSLVTVPDARLAALRALCGSRSLVPQQVEFHDVAGLVKGAATGAGLGNKFLDNIRSTSAICQVVRCFEDAGVIHVLDAPEPVRDMQIIEGELALADLQTVERRLALAARGAKGLAGAAAERAASEARLLREAKELLEAGLPARALALRRALPEAEAADFERLGLLTAKPMLYVCNVAEADAAAGGNAMTRAVAAYAAEQRAREGGAAGSAISCVVSAKIEAELALLGDAAERAEMLAAYGLERSGLDALIAAASRLLRLHSFFTVGPLEARSWRIKVGSTAQQAAAEIHTDLATTFIKAEVIALEDVMRHGGDEAARKAGCMRNEGKE